MQYRFALKATLCFDIEAESEESAIIKAQEITNQTESLIVDMEDTTHSVLYVDDQVVSEECIIEIDYR